MGHRFGRETWSVVLPEGWRGWHDPECATMAGGEEVGSLQISAYFKDADVLDEDLREFASGHFDAGGEPAAVRYGEFSGFVFWFGTEGKFCMESYLRKQRQMLFVTYTCSAENRGVEDGVVDEILQSLAGSGANAA